MEPEISVILPAYNASKYINEAIDSILIQSFKNFELIVINDGSIDETEEIVKSYTDSRIRYILNESNLGLIDTLNKGINLSKGKYIARMDADDISEYNRLELQYNFLENNDEYIICSSSRLEFSDNITDNHKSYLPESDLQIRVYSIFSTPFTHPSVMFRKNIFINNGLYYSHEFKYAEDYELWVRSLQYGKGFNFNTPLLRYRNTPNSQTSVGESNIDLRKKVISSIQLKALKLNTDIVLLEKDINFLYILSLSQKIRTIDFNEYNLYYINNFFSNLEKELINKKGYIKNDILKIFGKRYLKIIIFNIRKLKLSDIKFINIKLLVFGLLNLYNERK
ncbi:glycosyltransferase family 2 protein [Empedobacter brevis]|uniref:glycosyltransferase family 2 protein n=1 Tax=Empedobacter brevis TaxID=247 RepID=UPI0039B0DE52